MCFDWIGSIGVCCCDGLLGCFGNNYSFSVGDELSVSSICDGGLKGEKFSFSFGGCGDSFGEEGCVDKGVVFSG